MTRPLDLPSLGIIEAEGLTHLISPISRGEHTICGDAFDLASDVEGYEWRKTSRKVVTCPKCASVIVACRGVRISVPTEDVLWRD